MACGSAAVVTRVGGVHEFAVHGDNAFIVHTTDEDAAYRAVVDLVGDRSRLRRMKERAAETAGFSVLRAAASEYALFADEHAGRQPSEATVDGRRI